MSDLLDTLLGLGILIVVLSVCGLIPALPIVAAAIIGGWGYLLLGLFIPACFLSLVIWGLFLEWLR